jgi:hypothetical protein
MTYVIVEPCIGEKRQLRRRMPGLAHLRGRGHVLHQPGRVHRVHRVHRVRRVRGLSAR